MTWRGALGFFVAGWLALSSGAATLAYREDPHEALREILARKEFRYTEDPRQQVRERITHFINRTIAWIAEHLFAPIVGSAAGNVLALLVVLLAALGLVGIVVLAANRLGRRRGPAPVRPRAPQPQAPTGPDEWRRRAEAFAAEGRLRDALRCLYLMVVSALQRRGVLPRERSRTNREYLRAAAAQGGPGVEVAARLTPLVETFERAWYGLRPVSPETLERYQHEAVRLIEG